MLVLVRVMCTESMHPAPYLPIHIEPGSLGLSLPTEGHLQPDGLDWLYQHADLFTAIAIAFALLAAAAAWLLCLNQRLRAESRRRHALIETWPEPMLLLAEDRFVEANAAALRLFGHPNVTSLRQLGPADLSPDKQPDDSDSATAVLHRLDLARRGEVQHFAWEFVRADGRPLHVDVTLSPFGTEDHPVVLCALHDVTGHKEQEDLLRESEGRFRGFFEDNSSVMLQIDPDCGRILAANAAAASFYGHSRAELRRMSIDEINTLPPERIAEERRLAARMERNYFCFQHRLASGELRDVEVHSTPIRSAGRTQLFSIVHDVTARNRAQEALSHAEHLYRSLADGVSALIWQTGPDQQRTHFNEAWRRFTGRGLEQEFGDAWADALHPDDLPRYRSLLAESFDRRESFSTEYRLRRADGSFHWIQEDGQPTFGLRGEFLGFIGAGIDIDDRKRTEETQRAEHQRLQNVIEGTRAGTWEWDITTGAANFDARCAEMLGYRLEELSVAGIATWRDLVHPDDLERSRLLLGRHLSGELDYFDCEVRMRHQSGSWVWVLDRGRVCEWSQDGLPLRMAGTYQDITASKLAEDRVRLASVVFTHAREGIIITDANSNIIEVNDAFPQITGYTRAEAIGKNPRFLQSKRHGPAFYATMWRSLAEKGHWNGEIWNRRKNGEYYAGLLNISVVRDARGNPRHYVALFSDITPLKEHARKLEHFAHFDALTGLPNRLLLADRLRHAMAQVARRQRRLALAYIDLDGFKAVNDSHGHEVGDQLLMTVARHLKRALRAGDTIARLGGDEFVAVLIDLPDDDTFGQVLARMLAAASTPTTVDGHAIQISCSIGVTFYPQAKELDADQLLRQADQAMYQAKLAGKGRYQVFDTKDAARGGSVSGGSESIGRLQLAMKEREFVLHYQPKVNMRTGEVVGAEALLRWQHPERGLLQPEAFLPTVENRPLAIDLGEWVIDAALAQIEQWHAGGLDTTVSINLCARQLQQPGFLERLRALLAAHPGAEPRRLQGEVLEGNALKDLTQVSSLIRSCQELGVNFALDDFGTGYSSLTQLKRLPVDVLKIDRGFVRDMLDDTNDLAVLECVLNLAKALDRSVIAEGVETVAHGEMLLMLGCEIGQGFGIARPMPAAAFPEWVANWRPDRSWVDCKELGREDMPLLLAGVEHRAWARTIEDQVHGLREVTPPTDAAHCRFGRWLGGATRQQDGRRRMFKALETLHRGVHEHGARLLRLVASGHRDDALSGLDRLRGLRDDLHDRLRGLMRTGRS